MAPTRHAVHVEGLTRSFDGRAVIDGLRLRVRYGEFVALLGRSGSGRSTLLRVLAGLDRDISGTVLVPRRKAAVLQAPRSTPWQRVRRNALLGRAVAQEPELLLLDEPFDGLDAAARRRARRQVSEWWQRHGCAVLLATQDVDDALLLADRVLVLNAGVIAYETPVGLGRPRDLAAPRFAELRGQLLERLTTTAAGPLGRSGAPSPLVEA